MRGMSFVLIFFFYAHVFADGIDINEIRVLYEKSASDERSCKEMIVLLSGIDEGNPLLLGYKASGTMMMAKYVGSPFSKLSYFKKGKQMLEHAIMLDERNIELRFLRLMVQVNLPSFLGYNTDIQKDKDFILSNISGMLDMGSKDFVGMTLSKSDYLNSAEKRALNY